MNIHENLNPPIFPKTVSYGNAYVPFQQWSGNLYPPIEAFRAGTVFPELHQPYEPVRGGID
ncbi:MAG: spore coat associated protein CotJA [Defluviitaleaceae bacterium]|nr:spore coat associated protein CotJA [Defluviitaleaceae bacterium]